MRKTVRVSSEIMEEMFFSNGEKHYEITEGLPEGYKLTGIIRSPYEPDYTWLFVFSNNEKEADNDITPIFRTIL